MMERSKYIGSSDARDILSGDWERLYRAKMGLIGEPDFSENFAVQFGRFTEDFHLDWTLRKLNNEKGGGWKYSKGIEGDEQHECTFKPDSCFSAVTLGSHPDALVKTDTGLVYPCEAKHTGRWKDAEEAADFYMPQIQHHMLVWGKDRLLFSVIVGTTEPERIWVGASAEWQDHYIKRCDAFWQHVESQTPPPPLMGDVKDKPIVPTKIRDSVPLNGMKKRSLEGSNQAPVLIEEFITTKKAKDRHEEVKKELKAMMQSDESELYHPAMVLKRNKAGSILITVKDENFKVAKAA